jgi:hypothetical protein
MHTHTPNIHALSGIQTHDPSVRASEDSSCLRKRGYCDRRINSDYFPKLQQWTGHFIRVAACFSWGRNGFCCGIVDAWRDNHVINFYNKYLLLLEWTHGRASVWPPGWVLSLSLMLRPTVSRQICLGIKHPSEAYDQIFITVRQLRVCWYRGLPLTRGRACRVQLLLILASTVILGSESRGTRDYVLLSQIRDFPFRRLLRLAGLWWRYSTPPPHGITSGLMVSYYITSGRTTREDVF